MTYKINRQNTPNKYKGRKGWKPDIIVNHITEGSFNGAVSWLKNPASQASAHFVVSRKGEIVQLVDLTDSSWCNGTATNPNRNTYYGKSKLAAVRNRKTNANYYTISIEHEGFYNQTGGSLTPEQYKATLWLHKHIRSEVKRLYGTVIPIDKEHIVGHRDITPITKPNCPGGKYPFNQLIKDLKGGGKLNIDNLTDQEILKLKKRLQDLDETPSNWADVYWGYVKNKGLITQHPKKEITKQELAKVIYDLFNNNDIGKWAKDDIELAKELGITDGYNMGAFATREQAVTIAVRTIYITLGILGYDEEEIDAMIAKFKA